MAVQTHSMNGSHSTRLDAARILWTMQNVQRFSASVSRFHPNASPVEFASLSQELFLPYLDIELPGLESLLRTNSHSQVTYRQF